MIVTTERTTFGKLKPGDLFTVSEHKTAERIARETSTPVNVRGAGRVNDGTDDFPVTRIVIGSTQQAIL